MVVDHPALGIAQHHGSGVAHFLYPIWAQRGRAHVCAVVVEEKGAAPSGELVVDDFLAVAGGTVDEEMLRQHRQLSMGIEVLGEPISAGGLLIHVSVQGVMERSDESRPVHGALHEWL